MRRERWLRGVGLLFVLAGLAMIGVAALQTRWPRLSASPTPEPLIPTRTPTPRSIGTSVVGDAAVPSPLPTTDSSTERLASPTPKPSPSGLAQPAWSPLFWGLPRWGVGVAQGPISRYNIQPLRLGWYLDWRARANPPRPEGADYAQMIRLQGDALHPDTETVARIARSNPGSLWLIGNEPDVKWQDNVEPAMYARLYHEAYLAIKAADPTAKIAIGGISQPTPLRLRYLDAVLASYREQFGAEMPVDVWNVHNFILREERDSWGVDIPPGLPEDSGVLYEIEDSGNLEAFKRQIWDFRRWMAARGWQDRPLIVSEYGIPMPEDYGFPPERVVTFLRGTFDFFLTAADPALGYPADGYRLVQRWCWYSLADVTYPTGNLFDPTTGQMTVVGEGWVEWVSEWR